MTPTEHVRACLDEGAPAPRWYTFEPLPSDPSTEPMKPKPKPVAPYKWCAPVAAGGSSKVATRRHAVFWGQRAKGSR
jgi:hypothetical protein